MTRSRDEALVADALALTAERDIVRPNTSVRVFQGEWPMPLRPDLAASSTPYRTFGRLTHEKPSALRSEAMSVTTRKSLEDLVIESSREARRRLILLMIVATMLCAA
jgi:hypothetical protein